MQYITKHYSEAEPLSLVEKNILEEIQKHGMRPKQCIWGTSVCSDEVNNSLDGMSRHFAAPGPFRFGGISGIPFAGKTGFRAFASHIPDDGGAVIVYGPHIGISKNGTTGELMREGQADSSACCGSLIAGLENVKAGNILMISHDDYQQGQVNKLLIENYKDIKKADNQIVKITDIAYHQIKRELTDMVSACIENLGNSPLLLIGGIVINTDVEQEDYFEIRDISIFNS
ncbi:MAG: hypothetical protein JJ953_12360 [Gracilimonas sp.]|uniref:hypothetical protein n=1 Tax=Gracilimonas TaxID=649462 RepID=UPI001B0F947D|nr:hypothetical protein [Gracilimonas sp.]MBO6586892.1 hypothetical protein [Gracilimonas sp.]MBO6614620.1 hypothetical protein [Gracilimonas sp.]